MRILLTGANGFVGQRLLGQLLDANYAVTAVLRRQVSGLDPRAKPCVVDSLTSQQNWTPILRGHQVVIHAAARVHVMNETAADVLTEYRKVNVEGTLNLARQAAQLGVKRFIFISSIKVNGEGTALGKPYTPFDLPHPLDPYGISKWEAEQALRSLADDTGMEVVVIRPVLVYGPGVKANFRSMMDWLAKGVPLPLAAIHNKRSLVALDNLVDLILACVDHPAAASQTFLVSDGQDLSTTELLQSMGRALGKPARLLPMPARWLELAAALVGKRALGQRLCGSLQVDITHTCQTLNWQPPLSVDEGLQRTAVNFLNN